MRFLFEFEIFNLAGSFKKDGLITQVSEFDPKNSIYLCSEFYSSQFKNIFLMLNLLNLKFLVGNYFETM